MKTQTKTQIRRILRYKREDKMHTVAKFCFNWGIFSMSNSLKKEKVQVALNQGLATLFSQKYLPMT